MPGFGVGLSDVRSPAQVSWLAQKPLSGLCTTPLLFPVLCRWPRSLHSEMSRANERLQTRDDWLILMSPLRSLKWPEVGGHRAIKNGKWFANSEMCATKDP
jgi:hypothetical protein